jgi:lipoprotein-anchoring transpeptidase ErfK/SrfK
MMTLLVLFFLFNLDSITRKIVIVRDVRPQMMYCYEGDSAVAKFLVSTGKKGYETPLGRYAILTKRKRVWSKRWKCWMIFWQSITEPRPLRNGIHALEDKRAERLLGQPASHGCIRLSLKDAEWLFNWTKIGDSVFIISKMGR